MKELGRALVSEVLKLRRTLALWLVVLIPVPIPLLYLVNYALRGQQILGPMGVNPWLWMTQNVFILWVVLMQPLFVALEMALLGGVEHAEKSWRHLFALPVPRWSLYVAKLLVGLALVGVTLLVLLGWDLLAGLTLRTINPGIGFETAVPWERIATFALRIYLASFMMVALQLWISVRWPSFALSLGVGIVAAFLGLIASNTELWRIYPWSWPMGAFRGFLEGQGEPSSLPVVAGVIGGALVTFVGGWEFTRHDVA